MPVKHKTQTIGNALNDLLSNLGMQANIKRYEVIERWPEITGEQVAAVTKALRIENHVLFVQVASPTWRTELLYMKETILNQISREIGFI